MQTEYMSGVQLLYFPLTNFHFYRTLVHTRVPSSLLNASNASILGMHFISNAAPTQLTLTLKLAHHLAYLFHLPLISSAPSDIR